MMKVINEKQIKRNTADSIISGVCKGVADYFKLDAFWVRVATLIAFIFAPVPVVLAYFAAVVLLPRA